MYERDDLAVLCILYLPGFHHGIALNYLITQSTKKEDSLYEEEWHGPS